MTEKKLCVTVLIVILIPMYLFSIGGSASASSSNYSSLINPITTIHFDLPCVTHAEITIYNCNGEKVKTLCNQRLTQGIHSVVWNGKDNHNRSVVDGTYYYRIVTEKGATARKMIILK